MEQATADTRVFRANRGMLVGFGILFGLLFGMFLSVSIKNGDWTSAMGQLVLLVLFETFVFTVGRAIRLEVGPQGFRHRTALGSRTLEFASVESACLEVLSRSKGPGCPTLVVKPKQGRSTRVFLRHYPIEASVALFTSLESRGIPIELLDDDAVSVAEQIIAAKLSAAA